jgi:hypothetical protein
VRAALRGKYIAYAVTTHTAGGASRIPSGTTVRRRFSDFVALERLLKARAAVHWCRWYCAALLWSSDFLDAY